MRNVIAWVIGTALGLGLCLTCTLAAVDKKGADEKKAVKKKEPGEKVSEPKTKEKTVDDPTFARKASEIMLAGISVADLALKRAGQDDVRQYGKKLRADADKANRKLNQLADKAGFRVAPSMGAEHQKYFQKLVQTTAAKFDHDFLQTMLKGHKEAIALFEVEANQGKNKELKEYAASTLPRLREHLQMAQDLAGRVKQGGKEKSKTGGLE
jgi:putative membrane protein